MLKKCKDAKIWVVLWFPPKSPYPAAYAITQQPPPQVTYRLFTACETEWWKWKWPSRRRHHNQTDEHLVTSPCKAQVFFPHTLKRLFVNTDKAQCGFKASETVKWLKSDGSRFKCHISATAIVVFSWDGSTRRWKIHPVLASSHKHFGCTKGSPSSSFTSAVSFVTVSFQEVYCSFGSTTYVAKDYCTCYWTPTTERQGPPSDLISEKHMYRS